MSVRFRINKAVIQPMAMRAIGIIPSNSAIPVLQCFQLNGVPGKLSLTATNFDSSIKAETAEVQTFDTFTAVFPAKRFTSILSKTDSGDIEVEIDKNLATITSGTAVWQIQLPIGDAFPDMPKGYEFIEIENITRFKEALLSVRKCVATDTVRASLCMIHIAKGKMTACDSIRFAQASLGEEFPISLEFDIPATAGDYLVQMLKDYSEESFNIAISSTHLIFKFAEVYLFFNKMMASYPNVEQIMLRPALENKTLLTVDKLELLKAIARVRINADPNTEAIGLSISPKSLTVTSKDSKGNGASDTIPANWPSKDRLLIVNCTFLTQLVTNSKDSLCHIYLGEDTKSRKTVILVKEDDYLALTPQTSGNLRVF